MRALVINSNRETSPWPVPPIGACAVATAASESGHDVRMLDLCFEPRADLAVRETLEDFRPDVVGVSVRNIDNVDWQRPVFYLDSVKRDVTDIVHAYGRASLVLGGPSAGIMPKAMMDYFQADYLVRGDGETAFPALLNALDGSAPVEGLPGLVYRRDGRVHVGEPARAPDLDRLPLPTPQRWIDLDRYLAYNGSLGIQTKRGCHLHCTYCVYNRIEGRCYRRKSPQRVLTEVEEAVEAGIHSVEFVDSTFNVPLDHALDICRLLARRRLPVEFSTMGINPGAVTAELFGLLRDANFTEVSITPETASPPILKSLGKSFTVEDISRAAQISRRFKMPIVWYFMFGGPGETAHTTQETFDFMARNIPDDHLVLLVAGIRIFSGAPLEAQARGEGQIPPDDNLLRPRWYRPPIAPAELAEIIDTQLRAHPNYIALQDNHVPQPVLKGASALHRLFRAKRPLWQYLRHLRRVMNALGLSPHCMADFRTPRWADVFPADPRSAGNAAISPA